MVITGCWVVITGCPVLVTGCPVLVTVFDAWMLVIVVAHLVSEVELQAAVWYFPANHE